MYGVYKVLKRELQDPQVGFPYDQSVNCRPLHLNSSVVAWSAVNVDQRIPSFPYARQVLLVVKGRAARLTNLYNLFLLCARVAVIAWSPQ